MPSEDFLRRLEALNGGPLRETISVDRESCTPAPGNEIATAVTCSKPVSTVRQNRRPTAGAVTLEDALLGTEYRVAEDQRCYRIDRLISEHVEGCDTLGADVRSALPGIRSGRTRRGQSPPLPHEVAFFDVETLGLDMGSPIFLFGFLAIDADGRALCRQFLARSLEEEHAALAAAAEMLSGARLLVSFNGRSYDLPLLRSRADHFDVSLSEPPAHVDMLLEARRRYSRKLPNCRLQTLEARVCGRTRDDDVPSQRIPGVYRQFVKTGDASQLRKVVHHNLLDLATTAELFTLFFG